MTSVALGPCLFIRGSFLLVSVGLGTLEEIGGAVAHKGRACKVFLPGAPTAHKGSTFLPVSSHLVLELDLTEDQKSCFHPEASRVYGTLASAVAVQPWASVCNICPGALVYWALVSI